MAAAILNHHITAAQALTGATATPTARSTAGTNTASTSSTTDTDSSTISANDFLTLLVTEMKNQDPTADTDPNEYINQLVNVNSLEQLISINQTLSTDLGGSTASSSASANASRASGSAQAQTGSLSTASTVPGAVSSAVSKLAPGNLGIPAANPAAQTVAESLSGQLRM
jgi:flagellar basal-body rod modification protein FlgD